ncbi:hypothetical protein GCM10008983_16090 [Lentibacillus halophilus]|uniref:Thioredoxin domain-containing protein n=1 Tax=Lentibacillus halophilus TaxID=295065 RepID=A0ABP3J4N0_9BACI
MKRFKIPVLLLTLFLVACREEIETNISEEVSDFSFTTQNNETLSNKDLEGKWWIADFVFTNCTTVCPPMTMNMAELQQKMKEEDLNAQLVSFSVEPKNDTPEALKEFANQFQVDFSNWTFLTGYDFQTIKEFSIKSFNSLVKKPPEGTDQVTHGTRFYLVNPEGKVIKYYDGTDSEEIPKIIDDLKIVLNNSKDNSTEHASENEEEELKELKVNFDVPESTKANKTVQLKATVTYGDKKVTDADEMEFEYWKKGNKDDSTMVESTNNGDGTYTADVTLDQDGVYEMFAHTTAHGTHSMPKQSITVGDGAGNDEENNNQK